MKDGKIYGSSHSPTWHGFNIKDFSPVLDLHHIGKKYYSEIVEIDHNDKTKIVYVSKTDFSFMSASAITSDYIIFGNPFDSGKICSLK